MKKADLPYPWDYLAVELAVKIHNSLYGEDEDFSPAYEFMDEAREIIHWSTQQNDIPTEEDVEKEVNEVLSRSLSHQYSPLAFKEVASFIVSRIKHFEALHQVESS